MISEAIPSAKNEPRLGLYISAAAVGVGAMAFGALNALQHKLNSLDLLIEQNHIDNSYYWRNVAQNMTAQNFKNQEQNQKLKKELIELAQRIGNDTQIKIENEMGKVREDLLAKHEHICERLDGIKPLSLASSNSGYD